MHRCVKRQKRQTNKQINTNEFINTNHHKTRTKTMKKFFKTLLVALLLIPACAWADGWNDAEYQRI